MNNTDHIAVRTANVKLITKQAAENIHQPTRNLNRIFSAFLLLMVIFTFVVSWLSWGQEKTNQIYNAQNIMELGERAVDGYFTQLENGMRGLSQDIIETGDQIDLDHAFILVKRFKESHPELTNITFMREDGQVLFTAKAPPSPKLPTLAPEPSFLKFRNELKQGCPLSIGQPLVGLVSNVWIIPLRFVVHDKEGKLAYFISANLPVEILQNYWKEAPFTKTAALGLMRDDGFLVSRYPVPVKLEMAKVYGVPRTGVLINYLRQENFPEYGYVDGQSSLDGPNYLNAFRRLEHFPVTLFIAIPMSNILTGWWDKVKILCISTAVLLIGGFLTFQWTFRREHAREKEHGHAIQTLRESEDRFRNLFEQNAAVMLIIDPDTGNIIQANKAAAAFYGYSIEKLKQMRIQQINDLPPEAVKSEMAKVLSSGGNRLEFMHRRADGSIRNVEVYCSKTEIKGNVLLYSIIHDTTERTQARNALRESANFLNLLLEAIPVPVFYKNLEGRYLGFNKAFEVFFGKSKEQLIGKSVFDISSSELAKAHHAKDVELFEKPGIQIYDSQIRDSNSYLHNVIFHKATLTDSQGSITGLIGVVLDTTERKQAEEELLTLLSEKEMLLKEVHHRVKNNLASILGLLDLQVQTISDESARASMVELSNRIRSMALVHEQLYQSNDFSKINYQDYLEELCAYLRSSYHLSGDISVSVSAVGVMMGLDIAVPCGLLITELVANSFKHGFPASRSCTGAGGCKIDVSAQWDGVSYTLAVADNGVGLPAGLDWSNAKTLGLALVKLLGEHQLQGRIELDRTRGTTFRLRFAPRKG